MRIGVDLDGVVADFVTGFRSKLIGYGHSPTQLPDPDRWEMWECWGMTKETWNELFDKAAAEGMFHQLPAYEGAIEGLRRLKDRGHEIHIITHRYQPQAQTSTVGWLAEKGVSYDSLNFAKEKAGYPVDVMVEDSLDNAKAIEAAGVPVILMTRPWNEAEQWTLRAESWDELVETVNEPLSQADKATPQSGEVRETSRTGGQKGQKPEQYSMIPVRPLAEVARVYAFGAQKYSRDNWRKGYPWHNSYDALQRHVNAFWSGETKDPESGFHHLAHAVFHCFTLMTFADEPERYAEFDDRQKPTLVEREDS